MLQPQLKHLPAGSLAQTASFPSPLFLFPILCLLLPHVVGFSSVAPQDLHVAWQMPHTWEVL